MSHRGETVKMQKTLAISGELLVWEIESSLCEEIEQMGDTHPVAVTVAWSRVSASPSEEAN